MHPVLDPDDVTWLIGQGLARADPLADDTWTLTERFRIHAREIALERAYTFIAALGRRKAGEAGAARPDQEGQP